MSNKVLMIFGKTFEEYSKEELWELIEKQNDEVVLWKKRTHEFYTSVLEYHFEAAEMRSKHKRDMFNRTVYMSIPIFVIVAAVVVFFIQH